MIYTVSDHVPWAEAFATLGQFVFKELVEEASRFRSACTRSTLLGRVAKSVMGEAGDAKNQAKIECEVVEQSEPSNERTDPSGASDFYQLEFKLLDHMLAAGCRLTQKRRGWQLFCRDLQVPPFALWEVYPGYHRLRRTIVMAKARSHTAWLSTERIVTSMNIGKGDHGKDTASRSRSSRYQS